MMENRANPASTDVEPSSQPDTDAAENHAAGKESRAPELTVLALEQASAKPEEAPSATAALRKPDGTANEGPGASATSSTGTSGQPGDFITAYANYADVFEAPRKVHEWVGCQLVASAMNGKVFIPWGATTCTLDLWVLVLSESGQGRNTATDVALEVIEQAGN